nr:zinc finger, PHD-type [Tanacetum cinerariifolium]
YFAHLDCATSRIEPFMSFFLSAGIGKTIKNFKDADHPDLLKLPFPDQTYSILQHWLSKVSGSRAGETSERSLMNHISHQHVLSLCTRLPAELPNYPGHPQHKLFFVSEFPRNVFGIFYCGHCESYCNGFAYGCTECDYYIDVNCGFIPEEITHEAHPDHILSRCDRESVRKPCVTDCRYYGSKFSFSCGSCDFYLHSGCALSLPGIINHKVDKHPMKLTYGPVENHKSEYFCEVCEEELNPNLWFYHCHECAYSIHTRCAPVIVNFEAAIDDDRSLYEYLNIKFGGSYNIKGHEHSVSLALGSHADALPTPEVIAPIDEVIPPEQAESIGLPSSKIVDQDTPLPSKSQTTPKTQPLVIPNDAEEGNHDIEIAHMGNDPLFGMPIPEVASNQSSSTVSSHTIVLLDHQIPQHNSKWTKDHPLDNIIGQLTRLVST